LAEVSTRAKRHHALSIRNIPIAGLFCLGFISGSVNTYLLSTE